MKLIELFDPNEEGGDRDRGGWERCLKCGMRGERRRGSNWEIRSEVVEN